MTNRENESFFTVGAFGGKVECGTGFDAVTNKTYRFVRVLDDCGQIKGSYDTRRESGNDSDLLLYINASDLADNWLETEKRWK